MSRLVRIGKYIIELSGLHGIWVGPDHLSRSHMTLFYLDRRPTQQITYEHGKWGDCERDAKILKDAKKDFTKALESSIGLK